MSMCQRTDITKNIIFPVRSSFGVDAPLAPPLSMLACNDQDIQQKTLFLFSCWKLSGWTPTLKEGGGGDRFKNKLKKKSTVFFRHRHLVTEDSILATLAFILMVHEQVSETCQAAAFCALHCAESKTHSLRITTASIKGCH